MPDKDSTEGSHSLAEIKEALQDAQPSDVFCKVWPQAKQALEALEAQITNTKLKNCVKAVVTSGQHYYDQTCGQ